MAAALARAPDAVDTTLKEPAVTGRWRVVFLSCWGATHADAQGEQVLITDREMHFFGISWSPNYEVGENGRIDLLRPKGKRWLGIYERTSKRLKFSWGESGAQRSRDFTPGSDRLVLIVERIPTIEEKSKETAQER